jgi:hypothetical protein
LICLLLEQHHTVSTDSAEIHNSSGAKINRVYGSHLESCTK